MDQNITENAANAVNTIATEIVAAVDTVVDAVNTKDTEESEKEKILKAYVETLKGGIQQHTSAWLSAKKFVVGGSKMSTVLDCNGYETKHSAILTALGHRPFGADKFKCSWGNVFEDIIKIYVERRFNTTVLADNAFIPAVDGPTVGHVAYSPDGLCVIENDRLIKSYGNKYASIASLMPGKDSIVLLEFKAPYSRRTDPESIPQYYLPQPLTGLDMIVYDTSVINNTVNNAVDNTVKQYKKLCDLALFIECEFRLCEYKHLDCGRLHSNYPTNHPESSENGNPFTFGLFIVYGPASGSLYDKIVKTFGAADITNTISSMSKEDIDEIIVAIDENKLKSIHTGPCSTKDRLKMRRKKIIGNPSKSYSGLPNNVSGLVPYGTVYWKLLTFRVKPVFPIHNYLESHKDRIIDYTTTLKACSKIADAFECESYLNDKYGFEK